jgi:hypothetical protein
MKKITLILTLLIVTSTYAQFSGAGFYRLRNNFTTNGTIYLSHDGAKAIVATAAGDGMATDTTVFEFFLLPGTTDQYNLVVNSGDNLLRANSTSEIPLRAFDRAGGGSTSNPNVWSVVDSGSTGSSGETTYNILTPLTSSTRYLVYNNSTDAIGYSGGNFTRTQWIIEPLNPLSISDIEESSIFVSNPVVSEMIIKGLDNKVNKIEVFDLLGKSILEKNTRGAASTSIDVNVLTSGLYLVKLYGQTTTITKKIIKR